MENGREKNELKLFCCFCESVTESNIPVFIKMLSPEEVSHYNQFVSDKRKQEFLFSRVLLRKALSSHFCEKHDFWQLKRTLDGQLQIANKQYQDHIRLSLSHSKNIVVAAIGEHLQLGVDVEVINKKRDFLSIAENFFASAEVRELRKYTIEEARRKFFLMWTLKEALIKAGGYDFFYGLKFISSMDSSTQTQYLPDWSEYTVNKKDKYWVYSSYLGERAAFSVAVQKTVSPSNLSIEYLTIDDLRKFD